LRPASPTGTLPLIPAEDQHRREAAISTVAPATTPSASRRQLPSLSGIKPPVQRAQEKLRKLAAEYIVRAVEIEGKEYAASA